MALRPAGMAHLGTGCDHAAGGWATSLAHAYASRQPWGAGSWPASGRAPYGKCVGLYFIIFFARLDQSKRRKKRKKETTKENLGMGSDKVND